MTFSVSGVGPSPVKTPSSTVASSAAPTPAVAESAASPSRPSGADSSFEAGSAPRAGQAGSEAIPVAKPVPDWVLRPPDRLSVKDGVITTPGGYRIDQLGQFEWKITGPDGKNTRIWGDPHVDEGDGGRWDFKKNTRFVLPDGTLINVTTKPWGNKGMTVTGQLDIVNGDDHIRISDIDQGKGKVGPLQKDGHDVLARFDCQTWLDMGKGADDWLEGYREVVGHVNGGESLTVAGTVTDPGQYKGAVFADPAAAYGEWMANMGDARSTLWELTPAPARPALEEEMDAAQQMVESAREADELQAQLTRSRGPL